MTPQDSLAQITPPSHSPLDLLAEPAEADVERAGGGQSVGRSLETIQERTGLTAQNLRDGFRADPPRTIAEQAALEGVRQEELIDAIVAGARGRIVDAVVAGTISPERARKRLAGLRSNVTRLVTEIPSGLGR